MLAGAAAADFVGNAPDARAQRRYARLVRARVQDRAFAAAMARAFSPRAELRGLCAEDTIVCRCEDVTFRELQGQRGVREAKLQTRCGMGACQGRVCGPALQTLFGWESGTVRPPLAPAPVAAMLAAGWTGACQQ
jgi:hypothetical protein